MTRSDTKPAICHKCGKNLKGKVPIDAEEVTCFECCEAEWKARDAEHTGPICKQCELPFYYDYDKTNWDFVNSGFCLDCFREMKQEAKIMSDEKGKCWIDGKLYDYIPVDWNNEPAFLGDGSINSEFDWKGFRKNQHDRRNPSKHRPPTG